MSGRSSKTLKDCAARRSKVIARGKRTIEEIGALCDQVREDLRSSEELLRRLEEPRKKS